MDCDFITSSISFLAPSGTSSSSKRPRILSRSAIKGSQTSPTATAAKVATVTTATTFFPSTRDMFVPFSLVLDRKCTFMNYCSLSLSPSLPLSGVDVVGSIRPQQGNAKQTTPAIVRSKRQQSKKLKAANWRRTAQASAREHAHARATDRRNESAIFSVPLIISLLTNVNSMGVGIIECILDCRTNAASPDLSAALVSSKCYRAWCFKHSHPKRLESRMKMSLPLEEQYSRRLLLPYSKSFVMRDEVLSAFLR